MGQIGEILGFGLQLRVELQRGARTIVELLRDRMDGVGVDRADQRRPGLKERLGFKGFGCCGATWGFGPTTSMTLREDDDPDYSAGAGAGGGPLSTQIEVVDPAEDDDGPVESHDHDHDPDPRPCVGMNLAAALAAERQLRAALEADMGGSIWRNSSNEERGPNPVGTPGRVSLMRLLEETVEEEGEGERRRRKKEGGGEREEQEEGSDWVCCVCMGRKKAAAFIPCGHTFCRVCSREVWLNRGSCPLCNRPILEILDIY